MGTQRAGAYSRRTSTPWRTRCRQGGLTGARERGTSQCQARGTAADRGRGCTHTIGGTTGPSSLAGRRCPRRGRRWKLSEGGARGVSRTPRRGGGPEGDAHPEAVKRTPPTRLTVRTRTKNIQMRYRVRTMAWCCAGISSSMLWNRSGNLWCGQLLRPLRGGGVAQGAVSGHVHTWSGAREARTACGCAPASG